MFEACPFGFHSPILLKTRNRGKGAGAANQEGSRNLVGQVTLPLSLRNLLAVLRRVRPDIVSGDREHVGAERGSRGLGAAALRKLFHNGRSRQVGGQAAC